MRRGPLLSALALGVLFAVGAPATLTTGEGVGLAFADSPIAVGDRLEAVSNVSLDRAEIRKGSRVNVTRVAEQQGAMVVDLELADGYIVKNLSLAQVRTSFRVVRDA